MNIWGGAIDEFVTPFLGTLLARSIGLAAGIALVLLAAALLWMP